MTKTSDINLNVADKGENSGQRIFLATQTFPPRIGGMENVMHALSRNLAYSGFDVTVLPNRSYKGEEAFRTINIPLIKPLRIIAKRLILKFMLKDDDIVICDSWKSVNTITRKFNGRLALLAHGQEYLKNPRHDKRIQSALNRASLVVANSVFTSDLIRNRYNVPKEKLKIIPPTYMLAKTPQPQNRADKNNAEVRLISICRLDKRKGLQQAIEAIGNATEVKHAWRWDIIGNGAEAKRLKNLVEQLNLQNNIQFWQGVKDAEKIEMMRQADLFIMPAYKTNESVEGFGISYLEAAQYGVPAIAGNTGGSVEAVINGETGWCVDAHNIEHLQSAIVAAIKSPEERRRRGLLAYERFINKFSGPKVSDIFIDHMLKRKGKNDF